MLNFHQEALNNLLIIRAFQAAEGVLCEAKNKLEDYRKILHRKAVVLQIVSSGCLTTVNTSL